MRIRLPRSLAAAPRPRSPMFGVYFTLQQLAGRHVCIPDLTHALAKLRRSDVIRWLGAVSGWIAEEGGMEPRNQLAMADQLVADDLRISLKEHLQREPDVPGGLLHTRQLWFVLQMAVLSCKEDTPELPEIDMAHSIGECCLMANDILDQIEPEKSPGSGEEGINKWIASVVMPILADKNRSEIMARAQWFWFDLQANRVVRDRIRSLGVRDFDGAFSEKYGIPLRDFFLIFLSVYGRFQSHARTSRSPLLLDEVANLQPFFDKDHIRRVLDAVSQTPDELAFKLMREARQNWAMDFSPLRGMPVIQVFPGKYACPDQGLLYRWLTDGMYFLLQKAYPEGKFAELFGYVFEEYIHGLIREFSCESEVLVRTFYASPKFHGTNDEAGDGLVHFEDTAVVMEYKSRLLTTREKYGGISEVTLKGIDDILYRDKKGGSKGVVQLAKNLSRILKGERIAKGASDGLNLSACPHIFPAIITYEGSVAIEAVRQQADAKLRDALTKAAVDPNRIGPLLVLCTDDIEILEALAHKYEARQVIHEYVDFIRHNPRDRAGSFRSYVCNRGYAKDDSTGKSLVERTYRRAIEQAGAEFKPRLNPEPGA